MLPCRGLTSPSQTASFPQNKRLQSGQHVRVFRDCGVQVMDVDVNKDRSYSSSLGHPVLQAPFSANISSASGEPETPIVDKFSDHVYHVLVEGSRGYLAYKQGSCAGWCRRLL